MVQVSDVLSAFLFPFLGCSKSYTGRWSPFYFCKKFLALLTSSNALILPPSNALIYNLDGKNMVPPSCKREKVVPGETSCGMMVTTTQKRGEP